VSQHVQAAAAYHITFSLSRGTLVNEDLTREQAVAMLMELQDVVRELDNALYKDGEYRRI
jgi:hypothetical protein